MSKLLGMSLVILMGIMGSVSAKGPASGPGKVTVGTDASTWVSNSPTGPGLIPVGGSGQLNGEFTIAERYGIQIGLRAQERFQGPLPAIPNKNNKIGVYEALTGASDPDGRATWNYDWHVDLRNAQGVAAGTTLADYDLTLETNISVTTLFGLPLPLDLTFGGFVPGDTILYQSSQNPLFGNAGFDISAEATYYFKLILAPRAFRGPPLTVTIMVDVIAP